jgi:hypothetical protein
MIDTARRGQAPALQYHWKINYNYQKKDTLTVVQDAEIAPKILGVLHRKTTVHVPFYTILQCAENLH